MKPVLQQADLSQKLQSDFRLFLFVAFRTLHGGENPNWNWHVDAMCHALEATWSEDGGRLLITIPPRHLKSIAASVAFVAWLMGKDPTLKVLVASYGSELGNVLDAQFKTVVAAPWFRRAYPRFKIRRAPEGELTTTLGGYRKAVSVSGATTGIGANLIIVDDILKAQDAASPGMREASVDYVRGTLVSRLNDPEVGRIFVVGQRLHEYDLPGYCLETGLYRHLNLPAIAQGPAVIPLGYGQPAKVVTSGEPLYLSLKGLERKRLEVGNLVFTTQYLQDPVPGESCLIQWHRIARYEEPPPRHQIECVVQSWDTAISAERNADYTACVTMGFSEGCWYHLDTFRVRADFSALQALVLTHREKWQADVVVIEDVAAGKALLANLRFALRVDAGRFDAPSWRLLGHTPKVDKLSRWAAQAAKLETGFVTLPQQAPWLDEFRREVIGFPNATHDDQVDALSQFLEWAQGRTGRNLMTDYNDRMAGYGAYRRHPGVRRRA
jgi:predicted phage terminase large subunit-like protein